jgi:hypothetical protein
LNGNQNKRGDNAKHHGRIATAPDKCAGVNRGIGNNINYFLKVHAAPFGVCEVAMFRKNRFPAMYAEAAEPPAVRTVLAMRIAVARSFLSQLCVNANAEIGITFINTPFG